MANEPAYVRTSAGPTLTRDGKAFVRDPRGKLYQVDPKDVDRLLAEEDFLPASAEQVAEQDIKTANSTLGAKAKTFAESATAGVIDAAQLPLTLPVRAVQAITGRDADPLENISGRKTIENLAAIIGEARGESGEKAAQDYAEAARTRALVNPGTAMGGRVIGEVAGGLGVSGALRSGAGAAARALGGGALARTATGAGAAALEGAGLGAAQASEDAYIADIPLTAEKMVSAMGWGAIIGGGVGLGAAGLGRLTRSGSRGSTPFDSPRLRDPGVADDAVARGPYREAGDVVADAAEAAAPPNRLQSWLREFSEERTAKALGARGSTLKRLGRTAPAAEKQMRQMARDVLEYKLDDGTPVFRAGASPAELAETTARAQQELGEQLSTMRGMADDVFARRPSLRPDSSHLVGRMQKEVIAPIKESPLTAMRAQAEPLEQVVQDLRRLGPEPTVAKLTGFRQALDDQIYKAKRGVNLVQQGAAPDVKALERLRFILEEHVEAAVDKASQHFDEATATAYKATKVKYRSMKLANEIAGESTMQDIGLRVAQPSDYLTGIAAFAGDMAGGGGALSAMKGIAVGAAHKAVRENASSVLAVLADRMARNVDSKLDAGVGGFFNAVARPLAKVGGVLPKLPARAAVVTRAARTPTALQLFQGKEPSLQAAYQKRVEQLIRTTSNHGEGVRAATQNALGALPSVAPKLSQAAVVTMTRGAEYLKANMPAGLVEPSVYNPSRRSDVSDLDIAAFARRWATVSNPMSIVNDLQRGTVTHEQVDALKNVYPELYRDLQLKVLDRIREHDAKGQRLPLEARLQLDLLLDLNGAGEPALESGFIARLAQLLERNRAQQAQAAAPSKPVNLAKSRQSSVDEVLLR